MSMEFSVSTFVLLKGVSGFLLFVALSCWMGFYRNRPLIHWIIESFSPMLWSLGSSCMHFVFALPPKKTLHKWLCAKCFDFTNVDFFFFFFPSLLSTCITNMYTWLHKVSTSNFSESWHCRWKVHRWLKNEKVFSKPPFQELRCCKNLEIMYFIQSSHFPLGIGWYSYKCC